eukprot:scaffold5828_cov168-Amphora_coffeaeformis.AAC.11
MAKTEQQQKRVLRLRGGGRPNTSEEATLTMSLYLLPLVMARMKTYIHHVKQKEQESSSGLEVSKACNS